MSPPELAGESVPFCCSRTFRPCSENQRWCWWWNRIRCVLQTQICVTKEPKDLTPEVRSWTDAALPPQKSDKLFQFQSVSVMHAASTADTRCFQLTYQPPHAS